jgi:hypothetical protein
MKTPTAKVLIQILRAKIYIFQMDIAMVFFKIVLHESGSVIWANICSNYCNRFCGLDNDKYSKFQPVENCGLRAL